MLQMLIECPISSVCGVLVSFDHPPYPHCWPLGLLYPSLIYTLPHFSSQCLLNLRKVITRHFQLYTQFLLGD